MSKFTFTELVCEIVFMPTNEVTSLIPGSFYNLIKEDFPNISSRNDVGYQVRSLTEKNVNDVLTQPITVFKNNNSTKVIQLSDSILSLNSTDVNGIESFISEVITYYKLVNNILGIDRKVRHIHFRNIYNIEKENISDIENVNGINLIKQGHLNENDIRAFKLNTEYNFLENSIFGINVFTVFPDNPNFAKIVLDLSTICFNPEEIHLENIDNWLMESAKVFNNSIKEFNHEQN